MGLRPLNLFCARTSQKACRCGSCGCSHPADTRSERTGKAAVDKTTERGSMNQIDSTNKFLATYNAIENHFKSRLNEDGPGFRKLADRYADKFGMRQQDVRALRAFAELRNLLTHVEYFNGKPIAQPTAAVVTSIEALRDKILRPPTVLSTLKNRPVVQFAPQEPIRTVLDAMRKFNYSQFPVYASGSYRGLLTTNCVGRWLADRLATDELVESGKR